MARYITVGEVDFDSSHRYRPPELSLELPSGSIQVGAPNHSELDYYFQGRESKWRATYNPDSKKIMIPRINPRNFISKEHGILVAGEDITFQLNKGSAYVCDEEFRETAALRHPEESATVPPGKAVVLGGRSHFRAEDIRPFTYYLRLTDDAGE